MIECNSLKREVSGNVFNGALQVLLGHDVNVFLNRNPAKVENSFISNYVMLYDTINVSSMLLNST